MKAAEAINFDTHKFVKHLTENGFTEQQAEALADEQVNLLNSNLATKSDIADVKRDIEKLRLATKSDIESLRLATKSDIADVKRDIEALRQETKTDIEKLRLATKADIEALRQEIKTDMANLRAELVKWVYGAMIAQVILIVALVKLLP